METISYTIPPEQDGAAVRHILRAQLHFSSRAVSRLTRAENGLDLTGDALFLCDKPEDAGLPPFSPPAGEKIVAGPRVGVDYAEEARDFPWRFRLLQEV